MSRPSSTAPLTPTLTGLQARANEIEDILDHTPRQWFEKARHEADKAVLAERSGKPEDMFVAYVRTCTTYSRVKLHPSWKEEKSRDPQLAARVKDFMETYEAYLRKAKTVKEKIRLKQTQAGSNGTAAQPNGTANGIDAKVRPSASRQVSGPDAKALGSIADRMRMLQSSGMQADSSYKRVSQDLGKPAERNKAAMGGMSITGGAGSFGPARAVAQDEGAKDTPMPPPPLPPQPQPTQQAASDEDAQAEDDLEARFAAIAARTRRLTIDEGDAAGLSKLPDPPSALPNASLQPNLSGPPHSPIQALSPVPSGSARDPPHPARSPSLPQPPLSSSTTSPLPQPPALPDIPRDAPHNPPLPDPPVKAASTDNLDDFEKAFPSISEFSKQYEDPPPGAFAFERDPDSAKEISGLPNVLPSRPQEARDVWRQALHEEAPELGLPDVSSLPDLPALPSVPTSKPSLPVPPRKPDELHGTALGPPSPDTDADIRRAASTPNVAAMKESPVDLDRVPLPPSRSPLGPRPPNSAMTSPPTTASPALSFPVPVPTAGPSKSPSAAPNVEKLKFPLTNSIECDVLRTYILNPVVDVLLLDVRSEEETQRGYVGLEYEGRGKEIKNVWLDPHVVLRDGMNSSRLEDAMSLSPDAQRKAFEARDKADLVVVYDSHSQNWPRKDSSLDGRPPPLARMWEVIYENEFNKRLQRTPVLLRGGYDAWVEFIKRRGRENARLHAEQQARMAQANGHAHAHGRNGIPNGHGPPPPPPSQRSRDRSESGGDLAKRANRDMPVYQASQYAKNITDSMGYAPQSMTGESSSYTGQRRNYVASPPPLSGSRHAPSHSLSHFASSSIAPPPQASIHPGPGARRRSDYVEQHNQAYSGYSARQTIDYPQAHALTPVPQPPPAAQGHVSERYDRSAVVRSTSMRGLDQVAKEGDDVQYWNDVVLGLTGLKNLGNTCYMNSTLQCLSATYPFTSYFLDGSYKRSINIYNPMGMKGNLANAFAELLKALWKEDYTFLSPVTFRKQIISFAQQFSGTDQHDSQEFLSFVLDGLHEDLNRIKHKPPPVEMTPEREARLETLPPEVASETEWQIYKQRNDSFIVDLFQGQYRNRLECLTCHKTSTTYDTFMYLSLPVPSNKSKVVVQELIDEFVKVEIMTGDDAWNCPRCKVPRRATKTLTISRLPPVLLIQLKRFTTQNGVFWDKSETPVIFPIKDLDLTRYVPYRHPTGKEDLDDPRTQVGPFKYDLYGVSNHMGTLSSGHYTAYVKSSKGWMYCEDSRVSKAQDRDVVSRPAYILFYKRMRV